jgi:hypothetical protein
LCIRPTFFLDDFDGDLLVALLLNSFANDGATPMANDLVESLVTDYHILDDGTLMVFPDGDVCII